MLDGFERVPVLFGTPSVTFSGNRIVFNKAVVKALGNPDYVAMYLNIGQQKFGIEICNVDDDDAVCFSKTGSFARFGVRVMNSLFAQRLQDLMRWDLQTNSYRVRGVVGADSKYIIFNLSEAVVNRVSRKIHNT